MYCAPSKAYYYELIEIKKKKKNDENATSFTISVSKILHACYVDSYTVNNYILRAVTALIHVFYTVTLHLMLLFLLVTLMLQIYKRSN